MSVLADLDRGSVHAVVDFKAPPERIFRALTDPAQLPLWWGDGNDYRSHDWQLDLRVHGPWEFHQTGNDGEKSMVRGHIVAAEPPRMLEYTWEASWDNFSPTVVRYELQGVGGDTRLTVLHTGFAGRQGMCKGHSQGWQQVLAWLTGFVQGR